MPIRPAASAWLLFFALGSFDEAFPDPISSCTLNSDGFTQTCNLFQGSAATSGPVSLVNPVTAGFVVLLESDLTTWSDIVWFPDDGGGLADIVQSFSEPFDFAALPFAEGEVLDQATFVPELPTNPTIFLVSTSGFDDTFRVFGEGAVNPDIPEPSTLALFLAALIGIGMANGKRYAYAFINWPPRKEGWSKPHFDLLAAHRESYGVGNSVTAMAVPSVAVKVAPPEIIVTGKVLTSAPPGTCHDVGAAIAPTGCSRVVHLSRPEAPQLRALSCTAPYRCLERIENLRVEESMGTASLAKMSHLLNQAG